MHKNLFTWLVTCLMALALLGCSQLSSKPDAGATKNSDPSQAGMIGIANIFGRETHADDELLIYAKHFGDLSADNQKKEYAVVMQALSRNKKDTLNRLKAAMIFSLPSSRLRDYTRALPLLIELQRDKPAEEDINALVSLMKDSVEERQRLEDSNLKLIQKLKDEQRRADELQQKLDALKNIDKTMIERGQGTQK